MSRNVVGKVTLKVSSLNEMTEFYSDVIGLEVDRKEDGKAWLSPKNDDPLLVLNERQDAPPRSRTEAGLYHLAIRVPDRGDLAHSLARIRAEGKSLTGASDHLVSEALYLSDPEGNGIEVYHDRPKGEWDHTQDGSVVMDTLPLDLNDILEEKGDETHPKMPSGTVMGHVHIESSDLRRTEEFYEDVLGLNLRTRFGDSAIFLAVDDYHHHIGANSWQRRTEESKDESLGLSYFEFLDSDLPKLKRRLEDANLQYEETSEGLWVRDPDNIRILFKA